MRRILAVLVVAAAQAEAPVFAQENQEPPPPPAITRIELSVGAMYRDYREAVEPPLRSKEVGFVPVSVLRVRHVHPGRLWLDGMVAVSVGDTAYDGSDQLGNPLDADTGNTFFRARARVGFHLTRAPDARDPITFFAGGGYRLWERRLGGALPFSEGYRWIEAVVGARFDRRLTESIQSFVEVAATALLWGQVDVRLSEFDSDYENATGSLGRAPGIQIRGGVDYALNPRWSLFARPSYEWTLIGEGDEFPIVIRGMSVSSGFEPASDTHRIGLELGAGVIF